MPLVTTDNYCPGTPLQTPLHECHKSPYYVFSLSSFPVHQWSSPMSPVNSFPILFCGLSFAIHVASSTFAVHHPLLAPSLPGLGWKGHFPPRDRTAQDHFFSALDSMKHFCTMFWELGDILCYYRVLGQRQYAWSSSALFLRHRNNCEFLAGGSRFFTAFQVELIGLRLVHGINALCVLSDWTSVAGQGAKSSFPACVFFCIRYSRCPMWTAFILCLGLSKFVTTCSCCVFVLIWKYLI